mmetsp:Transcript_59287/g.139976  ORF Transcript_59287/g.139976 Transcript_59287/m.139976 type:complete len:222 (-) Transcript_59287:273-938(-)
MRVVGPWATRRQRWLSRRGGLSTDSARATCTWSSALAPRASQFASGCFSTDSLRARHTEPTFQRTAVASSLNSASTSSFDSQASPSTELSALSSSTQALPPTPSPSVEPSDRKTSHEHCSVPESTRIRSRRRSSTPGHSDGLRCSRRARSNPAASQRPGCSKHAEGGVRWGVLLGRSGRLPARERRQASRVGLRRRRREYGVIRPGDQRPHRPCGSSRGDF